MPWLCSWSLSRLPLLSTTSGARKSREYCLGLRGWAGTGRVGLGPRPLLAEQWEEGPRPLAVWKGPRDPRFRDQSRAPLAASPGSTCTGSSGETSPLLRDSVSLSVMGAVKSPGQEVSALLWSQLRCPTRGGGTGSNATDRTLGIPDSQTGRAGQWGRAPPSASTDAGGAFRGQCGPDLGGDGHRGSVYGTFTPSPTRSESGRGGGKSLAAEGRGTRPLSGRWSTKVGRARLKPSSLCACRPLGQGCICPQLRTGGLVPGCQQQPRPAHGGNTSSSRAGPERGMEGPERGGEVAGPCCSGVLSPGLYP